MRERVGGNHRRIGKRLVEPTQEIQQALRGEAISSKHRVICPEFTGDELRKRRFVEFLLVERDGEGLDRLGTLPSHERNNQRRVDSSGQECADRYVTDQLSLHRPLKELFDFGFAGSRRRLVCERWSPVVLDLR